MGLLSLAFLISWCIYFDDLPREYTEYGEMDLVAQCIAKSSESKLSPSELYQSIFITSNSGHARVPFEEEIHQAPLEIFIRSIAFKFFKHGDVFNQFKLVNIVIAGFGAILLYRALKGLFPILTRTWITMIFISFFPLITVGRVAGRLGPLMSAYLVGLTLIYIHKFVTTRKRHHFIISAIFCGTSVFNSLHSSTYVFPTLLLYLALVGVDRFRSRKRHPLHEINKKSIAINTSLFLGISLLSTACLILILLPIMGLKISEYWSELIIPGSYSRKVAHDSLYFDSTIFQQLVSKSIWFIKSHFITHYFYSHNNHIEEFRFDYPLFSYSFSLFALIGLVQILKRSRNIGASARVVLPFSFILIHIASALFTKDVIPPRYMMSTLLGYAILGGIGFGKLCLVFRRYLKWNMRISVALLSILLISNSYVLLYTGTFFNTGGNTLVHTAYTWAGNVSAGRFLEKHFSPDTARDLLLMTSGQSLPYLIAHQTRFSKPTGYLDSQNVLINREYFLIFSFLQHGRCPGLLFTSSAYPFVNYDTKKEKNYYLPFSETMIDFDMFRNPKNSTVETLNDGRTPVIRYDYFPLDSLDRYISNDNYQYQLDRLSIKSLSDTEQYIVPIFFKTDSSFSIELDAPQPLKKDEIVIACDIFTDSSIYHIHYLSNEEPEGSNAITPINPLGLVRIPFSTSKSVPIHFSPIQDVSSHIPNIIQDQIFLVNVRILSMKNRSTMSRSTDCVLAISFTNGKEFSEVKHLQAAKAEVHQTIFNLISPKDIHLIREPAEYIDSRQVIARLRQQIVYRSHPKSIRDIIPAQIPEATRYLKIRMSTSSCTQFDFLSDSTANVRMSFATIPDSKPHDYIIDLLGYPIINDTVPAKSVDPDFIIQDIEFLN